LKFCNRIGSSFQKLAIACHFLSRRLCYMQSLVICSFPCCLSEICGVCLNHLQSVWKLLCCMYGKHSFYAKCHQTRRTSRRCTSAMQETRLQIIEKFSSSRPHFMR
jgi:hypothetical protein